MIGAILGDIIGSPYEFNDTIALVADKHFPLFCDASQFTDDTVMTVAVAQALMDCHGTRSQVSEALVDSMREWGRKYSGAGYGFQFYRWLVSPHPRPYGSYGNGSAMRVSSVAWLYDSLDEVLDYARITAEVTHNHPEGIKGAQATAACIYLARIGMAKNAIKSFVEETFSYDLRHTIDQIRSTAQRGASCQETVPQAITAFLEGESFEDVIRTAVSLGGDTDTLAAMAGSIAEAFYGVPPELVGQCHARLPADLLAVLERFETMRLR